MSGVSKSGFREGKFYLYKMNPKSSNLDACTCFVLPIYLQIYIAIVPENEIKENSDEYDTKGKLFYLHYC